MATLAQLQMNPLFQARQAATELATNQQAYRAEYMPSSLGYARYFDHLLYSCEIGYSKPSIEYFSAATARVGIEPSRTLFIDDNETNVAAARDCGIHATLFHISDGVARFQEILEKHGLTISEQRNDL